METNEKIKQRYENKNKIIEKGQTRRQKYIEAEKNQN
jgi:hypothetical protein